MKYIAWMNESRPRREEAGGKAASLSELMAAGFPVPPGFCVLAEGYRHFIESAGLLARIEALLDSIDGEAPGSSQDVSKRICGLVAEAPMPVDLVREIAQAYERLCAIAGAGCAVRSSAVSEDGPSAAFAGLYETYLNVRGSSSVEDAVQRCFASLWAQRAIDYRSRKAAVGDQAMAVVVMSFVPAETSGVAFTAHPVTGSRDVIAINASFGLGEAIVSGVVTPDSFVFSKSSFELLERDIALKEVAVYPHPEDAGTVEQRLDSVNQARPSLSDEQARDVARLAAAVEMHCGVPQDVEWALTRDAIVLLQSRPITTLGFAR